MRFQVPQFIDVEDKIFGPLTIKQFVYIAGGASVCLIFVILFGTFFGLVLASPIMLLAAALAFYKINNRPFINILESAFHYTTKDKLYIWQKRNPEEAASSQVAKKKYSTIIVPNLSGSKLKDMNWELDVKKQEDAQLRRLS